MECEGIAKKYARSFLEITGTELSNRSLYKEPFAAMRELFELKETESLLRSPVMPEGLKKELLLYALEQVKHPGELKDFLMVLVEAGRAPLLPEFFRLYDEMLCEANGLVLGTVTSSCVLTNQELEAIRVEMEKFLGKKLSLQVEVDKSLLGGICLRYGHTRIDLSLKHKLDLLTAQVAL